MATARHGGTPAPYTKYGKRPYTYANVPLHVVGKGLPVTRKTIQAFAARHGIKLPRNT